MSEHISRFFATNVRQALVQSYMVNGDRTGRECAQRAIWEIASCISDIHGEKVAYDVVQRVADSLADRTPPELLPEPLAAFQEPSAQVVERDIEIPEAPSSAEPSHTRPAIFSRAWFRQCFRFVSGNLFAEAEGR